MKPVDLVIGLFSVALVSLLAVLLIRRRIYREFPFFFGYIISSILISILRLSLIRGDYIIYFKVYWVTEVVYAIATLLALHEAFRWVFLDFYEFWWFWFLFPGVAAVIVTFATVHALRHHPEHVPAVVGVILSLGIAVIYVKAGLFCLFLLFALLFTLQRHSYPFGIVLGFAVSALGSAFAYGLILDSGTRFTFVSKYAFSVAYVCGVIFWLDTFRRRPDPEAMRGWTVSTSPEGMLEEGQRYVKFLKGWGKKNDS